MEKRIELNVPFKTKGGDEVVWRGETDVVGDLKCYYKNSGSAFYKPNGAFFGAEFIPRYFRNAEWYTGPEAAPVAPDPPRICAPDETDVEMPEERHGLIPKDVWEENRREDVRQAIRGCLEGDEMVPYHWLEEYNELTKKIVGA